MSVAGIRQLIRTSALLAIAGCAPQKMHTGKAPEGEAAAPAEIDRPAVKSSTSFLYEKQRAQAAIAEPREEKPEPKLAVLGVAGTRNYHRPECPELRDVPPSEQVRFISAWDGLDGSYTPCPKCRPGP